MAETRIDISELKKEGSDVIKELSKFLEEKTGAKVETGTEHMILKGEEEEAVSRLYMRVLLRKFLHKQGLKDYFRVIGGKENALVLKEKKVEEEEE